MKYADTVATAAWEGGKVAEVTEPHGGYFSVTLAGSWGLGLDAQYADRVKVGDLFETAGGLGYPIQGVRVNGYVLWFKDSAAMEADRQKWLDDLHAKRRAEYEENKGRWREEVEALPPLLRVRMERFITEAGGFEPFFCDMGAYELFCCTEAVKFAAYFGPLLAGKNDAEVELEVRRFRDLGCEAQRALVPFSDGHSGNTFGGAVTLGARVAMGLDV
jgi:hypothetical protein